MNELTPEEQYRKDAEAAGAEVPKEPTAETPGEEAPTPEAPKETPKEEPKEPEDNQLPKDPKEHVARKLSEKYKEVKTNLKSETELREQAERERDEYKSKFEALQSASTPQEKKDAIDDLDAYAQEIGADPQALQKLKTILLKDAPTAGLSEEDRQMLQEVREFKEQNQKAIEAQAFEREFKAVTPTLKDMFPSISGDELEAVRTKLDDIAHSKEWFDKSLDYVAFKNKDQLSALVSPKKRGMESKNRQDMGEDNSPAVDLTAYPVNGSPAEKARFEEAYDKATKSTGDLMTNAKGTRIMI
jgi:hypothetical protein